MIILPIIPYNFKILKMSLKVSMSFAVIPEKAWSFSSMPKSLDLQEIYIMFLWPVYPFPFCLVSLSYLIFHIPVQSLQNIDLNKFGVKKNSLYNMLNTFFHHFKIIVNAFRYIKAKKQKKLIFGGGDLDTVKNIYPT